MDSWKKLCLIACLGLVTTVGQAQINGNLLMPPPINMRQNGWDTTLQNGNLTFGLPLAQVPGEVPIPVAFGMNATYLASSWSTRVYDPDLGKSVPVINEIDRPMVGGVHFGYITNASTYSGTTVQGLTVLEGGVQIADSQWSAFSTKTTLGGTLNLPQAFGFSAVSTASAMVDSSATYLSYSTAISGIKPSYQTLISSNLPSGFGTPSSTYKVVMDKNLARVFAWGASVNAWVPVLWADRFGHYVTFQWVRSTTGLPAGITAITKATATNQRSKGVVLRWADYSSKTTSVDVLRVDYVGVHAPSVNVKGYSGYSDLAPVGFVNPLGADNQWTVVPTPVGANCRPATITVGAFGAVAQPSWSGSGSTAAVAPGAPPADGTTDSAIRYWTFNYDANLAELTSYAQSNALGSAPYLTTAFLYSNYTTQTGLGGKCQPRGVSEVRLDYRNGSTTVLGSLWKRWTRTFTVVYGQPTQLSIKLEDWWDPNQKPTPDRYHQTLFPTDTLNYGNGVFQKDELWGPDPITGVSRIWSTTSYAWDQTGGGLDSTLSKVQSVTVSADGSPKVTTSLGYPDSTKLQVTQQNISLPDTGAMVSTTVNTYQPRWDMLESGQLTQVDTTRYKPDGVTAWPTVTQKNAFDSPTSGPSLLQLQQSYLDAGAVGKHGAAYSYDSDGRPYIQNIYHVEGSTTIASPNTSWVAYDSSSGAMASSNQMDHTGLAGTLAQTMGGFDSAGRPTTMTDASGITTTITYDDRGRVLSKARPGSATTTYAYPNELTVQATVNGATTTTNYDGFGRVVQTTLPTGVGTSGGLTYTTQTPTYEAYGRKVAVVEVNPAGTSRSSSWGYDPLDRLISSTPAAGSPVTMFYSVSGTNSKMTTTLANQVSSSVLRNALGQTVEVDAPDGTVTTAAYDGMGNQTSVTIQPANNGTPQVRTWNFDGLGRLTSKNEPETNTQAFSSFNALNQPRVIIEASGTGDARVRSLTFDGYGRMWGMANGSDNVLYTYTGASLTSASRTVGGTTVSQSFVYNGPGGLLSSETTAQPGLTTTIGYGYDSLGRLQTLTYPNNRAISYGYDALSRATSITNNGAALVSNIKFDDWGNRYLTQFASGAQDQWDADLTGTRLKTWSIGYVSGGPDGRSYTYDDATNILKTAGEWTLAHDNMGRLKEADGFGIKTAHDYDAYGNAIYHLATANGSAVPSTLNNYTFDPMPNNRIPGLEKNGALTGWNTNLRGEATQVGAATASSTVLGLTWDGLGLLKSVVWNAGNQAYLYAPTGMRVGLTDTVTSANSRKYAYSAGGLLLGDYLNGSGTPTWNRDVVYLGSQALAEIDGNGVHELHSDHLGSPRLITKGAGSWGSGLTGTMDGTQAHGPYGELMSQTGYVPLTGYTGHIQTDASGLIYMRGRFYSPAWHAFLNSDQGVDPSTWNQRAYVGGSPFMGTDPSGMMEDRCVNGQTYVDVSGNGDYLPLVHPDGSPVACRGSSGSNGSNGGTSGPILWWQMPGALGGTTGAPGRPGGPGGGASPSSPQSPKPVTSCNGGQSAALMGAGAGLMEYGTGSTTIGTNFKPYVSGWGGNQYVSTTKISNVGKGMGIVGAAASSGADYYNWQTGQIGTGHFATNLGFTGIGLRGGPIGAAISVGYSLIDNFYPGGAPAFGKMLITPDKDVVNCPSLYVK